MNKDSDSHGADGLANYWKKGTRNLQSRAARDKWNSIFKHSLGIVQTRYANNKPGYQFNDYYGHPESGVHLFSSPNRCSDFKNLDMALAFRARPNAVRGYCYNNGQPNRASNCICADQTTSHPTYGNRCKGSAGNWRRYNGPKSANKLCSSMSQKCYTSDSSHGNFGDSYSCDVPGQRHVGGHMWYTYSGYRGMPCTNYGGYGCYGSRWIR